jgi:UDP-hydrolysing UDP-N-acetyl-D-glucosamine 2-epimerase
MGATSVNKRRRICFVLTSRGNYGKLKSIIRAAEKSSRLDTQVVVGGSLLLDKYGRLMDSEITDDIKIDQRVHFLVEGENLLTMAKSAGLAMLEFASAFDRLEPDIVVVIADRFECLPIAMAAAYMNIPVAHLEGGEISGSIDESIRHAITKLAQIHLPATQDAADRIIRMGEAESSVCCVGSSSFDALRTMDLADLDVVRQFNRSRGVGEIIDLEPRKYLVVIQHPVTTEYERSLDDALETAKAVDALLMPTVWIWPNMDAGSDGVSRAIRKYREEINPRHVHFHKSLPIEIFGPLLRNAGCIVGNSSSGIRESEFLGTPAVNVGSRQSGRQRGANVTDVDNNAGQIQQAVEEQLRHGPYSPEFLYGNGHADKKVVAVLEAHKLIKQKRNSF